MGRCYCSWHCRLKRGTREAPTETEARPKAKAKSRAELPECNFTLTRGPRKGQPCGKRGCKAHGQVVPDESQSVLHVEYRNVSSYLVPVPVAQPAAQPAATDNVAPDAEGMGTDQSVLQPAATSSGSHGVASGGGATDIDFNQSLNAPLMSDSDREAMEDRRRAAFTEFATRFTGR